MLRHEIIHMGNYPRPLSSADVSGVDYILSIQNAAADGNIYVGGDTVTVNDYDFIVVPGEVHTLDMAADTIKYAMGDEGTVAFICELVR